MSFTAKLDLEEIAYGATGWNAIVTTNMQKIDDAVHTIISVTAGETITSYAAVYLDTDGKYDLAQADGTQQPAMGISLEVAVLDGTFRVQRCGPLTYASWTWTPGAILYLDPSTPGDLTETKPSSNAQVVAFAMSATKIYIWPEHQSSLVPFPSTGVEIYDTDSSHTLSLKCGSDLTADRDLSFVTGDAGRTITLSGDPTLGDWFDQAVKAASSPTFAGVTLGNEGLHILDTNASHDLVLKPGSDLTADRILTLVTGDAARTITLSGDPTLGDWFDQEVKAASGPTFASLDVTNNITVGGTVDGVNVAALETDVNGFPDRLKNLVTAEIQQLENIGSETISATQWGYLGELDQSLKISGTPIFLALKRSVDTSLFAIYGSTTNTNGAGTWLYGRDHATNPGRALIAFGGYDATGVFEISHRNTAGVLIRLATMDSTGNVGIGTVIFGTSAAKVFGQALGTAPTTQPADIFQMWAADQAAGNCCPHIMTEGGATLKLYQETALTSQLTTITHTAPGTPDYAIQDLTNSSPYGFVTQDEGNSVLSVIANLQARVDELETKLQAIGFLA